MIFDQVFFFGLCLLPIYIDQQTTNPLADWRANLFGILSACGFTLGLLFLTYAFRYAKAGNVMAIENSKNVIQTLIVIIIQGIVPNLMEISGLVLGMLGVAVIVL